MTAFEFIEVTIDSGIGFINLNRPRQYNSLNRAMVREIVQAMELFDRDEGVQVIVLAGNGKAFHPVQILMKWRQTTQFV